MTTITFSIISIIVALTSCVIAGKTLSKKSREGHYLAISLYCCAAICVTYLASILAHDEFTMSLFASVYFAIFDVMLISLLLFVRCLTKGKSIKTPVLILPIIYATFDVVILLSNPWTGIAIKYLYTDASIQHWRYMPEAMYQLHLIFSYVLIGIILELLIVKIVRTPRAYRSRYTKILIGIMVVVIMNAVFLFLPKNNLPDFSVIFYSIVAFVLYWNTYHYSQESMLAGVNQLIVDEVPRPMLLFDYEKKLVMHNALSKRFCDISHSGEVLTFDEYIDYYNLDDIRNSQDDNVSFQWVYSQDGESNSYRCDFSKFKDKRGRIIGYFLVFTNVSKGHDILTGFQDKSEFVSMLNSGKFPLQYPLSASVLDINNLHGINITKGKTAGDNAIKRLSMLMKEVYPNGTVFIRLNEAVLVAVSSEISRDKLELIATDINVRLKHSDNQNESISVQSAIAIADGDRVNILEAIETARVGMRARKMLDNDSAHSSLLASLVQTLRESDDETEAHVRRTNKLGQMLAYRMNLSDRDKNNLALLCLLHDIGKVGIPLEILNKPGKLKNEEWEIMKSHTEKGYRIAKASRELSEIAESILHHHEAWDGNGYPDGLKGENIPMLSRIIAIVDAYDAMTNDRVYRKAMSRADAVIELQRCAGKQFDPKLVSEFIGVLSDNNMSIDIDRSAKQSSEYNPIVQKDNKHKNIIKINSYKNSKIRRIPYCRYTIDTDNRIIVMDDNFESLTGYSAETVKSKGLTQLDLIPSEDQEEYTNLARMLLEDSQEAFIEHRIRRSDGQIIWVQCMGVEYFNPVAREGRTDIVITKIDKINHMKSKYTIKKHPVIQ